MLRAELRSRLTGSLAHIMALDSFAVMTTIHVTQSGQHLAPLHDNFFSDNDESPLKNPRHGCLFYLSLRGLPSS